MSRAGGARGALRRGIEAAGLLALQRLDPERAHGLALAALAAGLGPETGPWRASSYRAAGGVRPPDMTMRLAGLTLANPLGIAAGFDKDAGAAAALSRAGPGFVELGAVTPRPQAGNPRPRLFRLPRHGAAINRFGFNNAGMDAMAAQLERLRAAGPTAVPVGLNLGANKDSGDRADDYAVLISRLGPLADFLTINISSPNTERLRDLQGAAAIGALLAQAQAARAGLTAPPPLWLKIAPDLDEAGLDAVAEAARAHRLDAVIATNTTLARDGVDGRHAAEAGGLSGRPLMARSTAVLAGLRRRLGDEIALVGVGGVASGADAYAKVRAGASAVQLYTALAYGGLWRVHAILDEMAALLARDGYASLAEAVGADVDPASAPRATRASSAGR